MRAGWLAVAAGVLLTGCGQAAAPRAERAWVRLAAVPGRPAAAYLTLRGGAKDATLTGASVAGVPRVEMHESRMAAGGQGMTMDALPSVPVPAGATVAFAPTGKHLMLFGVPAAMTPGSSARLTLRFADGHVIETDAAVRGAGDAAPE